MDSTRGDAGLARSALAAFGVDGRLRRVATGLDTTYRVTVDDGTRLALRVGGTLDIRSREAIGAETAWLETLAAHTDVRVPRVLRAHDGSTVQALFDADGRARYATLLSWLPGRKMRWRFTERHAAELGRAAAQLHLHAATKPVDTTGLKRWADRMQGAGHVAALVAVAGPEAAEVTACVDRAVDRACRDLGDANGIINGDLGPHNTVWDTADPRAGLFDFNDAGIGPYAFDLARYIHGIRWRPGGERLVAAALDGYQSVASLPAGWHDHGAIFEAASDLFLARYLAPKVQERGPGTVATIDRLVRTAAAVLEG